MRTRDTHALHKCRLQGAGGWALGTSSLPSVPAHIHPGWDHRALAPQSPSDSPLDTARPGGPSRHLKGSINREHLELIIPSL